LIVVPRGIFWILNAVEENNMDVKMMKDKGFQRNNG